MHQVNLWINKPCYIDVNWIQMHMSSKVFHASSEFVKHHVSLMIVPSWAGHSSCKKLHHVLLFQMSFIISWNCSWISDQCLGCDACNFSPVLFLQSPDLAPILFLQSPNFLSAIDFDVIWNHQSLVLSQMNQLHISFKVFHAVSEFVKNHVSLMIVPSCWAGHSSCKKLHHVLLFQMSS